MIDRVVNPVGRFVGRPRGADEMQRARCRVQRADLSHTRPAAAAAAAAAAVARPTRRRQLSFDVERESLLSRFAEKSFDLVRRRRTHNIYTIKHTHTHTHLSLIHI